MTTANYSFLAERRFSSKRKNSKGNKYLTNVVRASSTAENFYIWRLMFVLLLFIITILSYYSMLLIYRTVRLSRQNDLSPRDSAKVPKYKKSRKNDYRSQKNDYSSQKRDSLLRKNDLQSMLHLSSSSIFFFGLLAKYGCTTLF